jgi:hypothetical protein
MEYVPMDNLLSIEYPVKVRITKPHWEEIFSQMGDQSEIVNIKIDREEGITFGEYGESGSSEYNIENKDKSTFPIQTLEQIKGIGTKKVKTLEDEGLNTISDVYKKGVKGLKEISGISERNAKSLIKGIKRMNDSFKLEMEKEFNKVKGAYSTSFLRILKKALPLFDNDDYYEISLLKDHPIKITAEFDKLGFAFLMYLAPRVEETEWGEDDMEEF